ncbi:hypothetical protein MAF45_01345 [Mesosutterella sp. OilRF-GAM-744-9]|uniref:Aminotransferase class I/classII domain-containing protein n=1 Tax=Mesosutterella porci TaxID=2915351 RepID=A0ABS9MN99_9BURK|nr:hypothetical protein [Mesosutterella sp. oilRF-744-WT-GAM-9]MCG5030100.1 hypothetical protein [Mesosutterella sp. oilRF-744-WT-GAM-9]
MRGDVRGGAVITNPRLAHRFRARMKQSGAVLAKGWLLGLQFWALLEKGLYFSVARRVDELALRIRGAFEARGIELAGSSPTNQQFVLLGEVQKKRLVEKYIFEDFGTRLDGRSLVRFCMSWSTTEEEVEKLLEDIRRL